MGSLWRGWRDVLVPLGFDSAARDAKLLAAHALGYSVLDMATREQAPVSNQQIFALTELMQRRMRGESVARIIGEREFYGLLFTLDPATLEPRPETELLVELAIKTLPPGGRLLELGTGTGCIPIAVLAHRSDARAIATDINARALEVAQHNGERHGVSKRIHWRAGSWFQALQFSHDAPDLPKGTAGEQFDLIVSNPPYIASAVIDTLAAEVRVFDPRLALDGGPDGLAPYRIIAEQAPRYLVPSGIVLVEIGFDQGEAVPALFRAAGFSDVRVHQDLNGLDRVVEAHHLEGTAS